MEAVDLRPLSLGELLDRTFRLYRNHFLLFVGIMAIPAALLLPMNVASFSYQGSQVNATISSPPKPASLPSFGVILGASIGLMVALVVFGAVYSVAIAAASTAVADVYLGRPATIRVSFHRIRGRFWRLLGVVGNIFLRVLGALLLPLGLMSHPPVRSADGRSWNVPSAPRTGLPMWSRECRRMGTSNPTRRDASPPCRG